MRRLPVILVLGDGRRQEAAVFLSDGQQADGLLDCPEPFLPAQTAGRIRLYARGGLACIAVPPDADPGEDDGLPYERRAVVVGLLSGVLLTGELRYVSPPERRRTADFLNEPASSFALHGGEATYHVAKRHVAYVEEA